MTVTISAEDTRSIRAIEIAAGAAKWLHIREVGTGRVIGYQIPSESQQGVWYVTTQTFCTCQDARRRAGQPCKHQLAVRLHVELQKASASKPRTKRSVQPAAAPAHAGNVLQMIREADGTLSWERAPRTVDRTADVARAARYDAIFGDGSAF